MSIWNASATPGVAASGDGTSVELGVKFRSEVSGSIKGIRFYKGANNTGTHIGNLWTSAGALLGTATFANEAATGWQQVLFASPIVIAANTTYVASYFAPNGNFASDGNYFTAAGVDNPPLHALSAVAGGGNGVFVYRASSGFPNSTYQGYNYWVDVVFDSSPTAPPAPTGLTATAGNGQVTLSWTGVAGATSYNVKQGTASGGPYTTIASPTTPGAVSGGLTNGTTYYYVVTAVNGNGESGSSVQASATPVTAPAGCGTCVSIWNASATPGVAASGDGTSVELGVKFRSEVSGSIKGIRFYKGANNTGTHIGNLWTSAGALLGTATFANEAATGWQQVLFASPIVIAANTTYVASYFAPNGNFASDGNYFTAAGVDNPPLHALSAVAGGGNGVFVYRASSGFPNSTYQGYNYWIDVLFDKAD